MEAKKVSTMVVLSKKELAEVTAVAEEAERKYHVSVLLLEVGQHFNQVAVRGFSWDVRRTLAFIRPTRPVTTTVKP